MSKISIRFFNDREVRAIWNEEHSKWFFAAVDIVAVLNEQPDYTKNRNYWKYLKNKLKKDNPELVSAANQLKLTAPDGKKRLTDCFDSFGIVELAKNFPNNKASKFLDWFLYSENTIDGQIRRLISAACARACGSDISVTLPMRIYFSFPAIFRM